MSGPFNWFEESNKLFRNWNEQQQAFWKSIAGQATTAAPVAPFAGIESSLSQTQELWRSAIEQWMALGPQALGQVGKIDELLKTSFDPAKWAQGSIAPVDRAIEHLVDGPSYATLLTLDRQVLRAQKLRAEWARDLAAYQLVVQRAWSEALQRFLKAIHSDEGAPIRTWRELTDLWVDTANDTLVEAHRTPEFLEAQRRLTRSSTECRLAERAIAEAYCELNHIPTRTEVDELAKTVVELRRELRALKSAVHPARRKK